VTQVVTYLSGAEADALEAAALPAARTNNLGCYRVADTDLAIGSTLGGPKAAVVLKATGALEKVFCVDTGSDLIKNVTLAFWDAENGVRLNSMPGTFVLHPSIKSITTSSATASSLARTSSSSTAVPTTRAALLLRPFSMPSR